MPRPCFLVIDREFPGSISTRKLVIETAKLNVITAYSPDEAVETLKRFPNVDGVVFDAETEGTPCTKLVERLRGVNSEVRIIVTSPGVLALCGEVPQYLESHDPERLLEFLKALCKRTTQEVSKRERQPFDEHYPPDELKAS